MSFPKLAAPLRMLAPDGAMGFLALIVFLSLAPLAWSQNSSQGTQPSSSTGAGPSQTITNPSTTPSNSSSQLQPDTHPLGGAFMLTLGSLAEGRSYLQPEFSLGEMADTNAAYIPNGKQRLVTATVPEASLVLFLNRRRNSFSAGFLGGGYVYNNAPGLSSYFQSTSVSDSVQFRRFSLGLSDVMTYLPNSGFGFGSFGGLGGLGLGSFGSFGGGLGQINPSYTPNQSILTTSIGTFNNTTLVQAQYALSARTSFTAVGSYGILRTRRQESGFFNGTMIGGSGSLGHSLTARDTAGVSYQYGAFRYAGQSVSFNSHSVDFDYGRRITGRTALQLSAGPEYIIDRIGNVSRSEVLASGFGNLTYSRGRDTFTAAGGRYATSGSGILTGADTVTGSGGWTRQLSRRLESSLSGGVSRNSELVAGGSENHYEYWFSGATLTWALGRYISMYANYSYQRQITNAAPCTNAVCAGNLARQIFGIGFIFTPRPFGL
ncbi:MAG: hypothetical protein KGM47_08165 [Acidobacteriota bacterium]|nr:hypothetical protein [Acidobacteriota bacterium]